MLFPAMQKLSEDKELEAEIQAFVGAVESHCHIGKPFLESIRHAIKEDIELQWILGYVRCGWPAQNKANAELVRNVFGEREWLGKS